MVAGSRRMVGARRSRRSRSSSTNQHDAVESDAEPALDAEWSEVAAERRRSRRRVERPYAAYMASLRHLPRLDREEEHRLRSSYLRSHDPKIATRLIHVEPEAVVKLAHEYTRAGRTSSI